MLNQSDDPRPGMLFIDRYMPGASAEEREEAHTTLQRSVGILIQIDDRWVREARESDSLESVKGGRVDVEI